MKRVLLFASLLVAVFAVSCKKETPVEDAVTISTGTTATVPQAGDVVTIKFNSTVAWTAKSSESWLTVSPASGEAGDATIKASAVKNDTNDSRTAEVTITAGTKSAKVTVTQGQLDALNVGATEFEVPVEGGTIEIPVSANVSYTVQIPDAIDWITVTKGMVDSKVVLDVAASTDPEVRVANIAITDGTLTSAVKITQAAFVPVFDWVEPYNVNQWSYYWGDKLYLPQEGFDITIDVNSNIEWRAFFSVWSNDEGKMVDSFDLGWCQLSFDENTIHLVGSANDTYVARNNYLYCECIVNGAVSGEYGALCEFIQDGLVPEAGASVLWTRLLADISPDVKPGYNRLAYKTSGGDALLLSDGEKVHVLDPASGSYWKSIEWSSVKPTSICSDESGNVVVGEDIPFSGGTVYTVYYTTNVNENPVPLFTHTADFEGTIGGWRVRGDLGSRAVVTGFVGGSRYWAGWEIDSFNVSYDNYYNVDGQTRGPIAVDGDAWSPESGAVMSVGPRLNEGVMYRAYDTAQNLYYLADAYTPNWVTPYQWQLANVAGAGGDENQDNMDIIDYQGRRIMAYTQGMQWNYITNADVYFLDITNPNDVKVIAILDTWEQACVEEVAIGEDYGWACSAAYTSADVKLHVEEGIGLVCYVVNSAMESLTKVQIIL